MIEIKNLKKVYSGRTVLDIPYLKIEKGECVILTGHNGSGKSTLIKILAGTLKKTEGQVNTDGKLYYLPQQSLAFNKSVRKNLTLCLEGDKKKKAELCDKVLDALRLKSLADKNAKTLSGGECQRLALGRVICKRCDILLLDEPSSAADSEGRKLIDNIISQYVAQTGCILIMTTHTGQLPEIEGLRRIELCDGKIIKDEKRWR